MKINETMTREERRVALRATTENRDHLITIHQQNTSPADTVAELISRIGYQAAQETIAEAVNARGDWDERISGKARAWAATIDTAADRDTLRKYYLTTDAIHPAHVDQIARAMMRHPEPELAAEAVEDVAPAEEAPEQQPVSYLRADGDEATHSAAEALSWHRAGHDVIVARYGKNAVYIHGAPQEAPQERNAEQENRNHCRRISDELDAYVSGEFKRCPDCGEVHRRDWGDVGDAFKCPNCGEVASVDDWEWLGVYDFLSDALDIEYIVDSRREFRSCRVMVAYGGPTIYIDTDTGNVELYWWNKRARHALSSYALDAVNEYAEELWNM